MKIKKGDFVARKSYKKDILFIVDKVIQLSNGKSYVILKGVTIRIEADAPIEDVEKVEESRVIGAEERIEKTLLERIKNNKTEHRNHIIKTGKILQLDGDKRYSEKSIRYYKKMGLNAVVKNISESKQPIMVRQLLETYKPDILVITGHDAMLKNGMNYSNI